MEAYRGRGYGKMLLALALAEAKSIGLNKVRLTCLSENPVSRHIIEDAGAARLGDVISKKGERYHLYEISLGKRASFTSRPIPLSEAI